MYKIRLILFALVAAAVCSCKEQGGVGKDDSRLQYAPEQNAVEVITLERQDFARQLLSNGKLAASRKSALYFKENGVIMEVNFANGDRVRAGDVIARLDDRDQRSALRSAELDMDKATLDYMDVMAGLGYSAADTASAPADVKKLARIRSGYSSVRLNYEKAVAALEGTVMRAPFSGKVADLSLGVWDRPGSEAFCTVIDDSSFEVSFSALESEYLFLSKGLPVKVSLFSSPDRFVTGQVSNINPTVDKNGQIGVRAVIRGESGMVDGMNAKVMVEKTVSRQLVVPKSAVVVRDNLDVLFRYNSGRAEWVYVNILDSNSESFVVEANEGRSAELNPGDQVIVSGNLNLAEGSNVVLKQ